MAFYQEFESLRTTEPDFQSLLTLLRTNVDPACAVAKLSAPRLYVCKKPTAWTAPQITAAQSAIDTAPEITPQLTAQRAIDQISIFEKAILLTIIDEINRLRTQPTTTFAAVTPAQVLAAVRIKAGTL